MSSEPKTARVVTDSDVEKYTAMVEMFLRDSVKKNWNEASLGKGEASEISLGNTGMTMSDMRQHLLCEVVVALQKYNPNYRTKEGRSVKESTFVHTHLWNRVGQLCVRLTKSKKGYGMWPQNLEDTFFERGNDAG